MAGLKGEELDDISLFIDNAQKPSRSKASEYKMALLNGQSQMYTRYHTLVGRVWDSSQLKMTPNMPESIAAYVAVNQSYFWSGRGETIALDIDLNIDPRISFMNYPVTRDHVTKWQELWGPRLPAVNGDKEHWALNSS